MAKLRILLPLLLLAAPIPSAAAPADVAAGVSQAGRPEKMIALDASRKPAQLLGWLGLERGDRVLDVWVDEGYYAEIIGKAVGPSGAVVGWNPDNFTTPELEKTWAALIRRTPNVTVEATPGATLSLPANSFDLVLFHLSYHDLYWESAQYKYPRQDPDAFLRKVFAATRPGGIVGVVDHVATAGSEPRQSVDKLHRIDPAVIRADFARAGFVPDGESDLFKTASDDHGKLVFDPAVRGKTDRVVYRFRKPSS